MKLAVCFICRRMYTYDKINILAISSDMLISSNFNQCKGYIWEWGFQYLLDTMFISLWSNIQHWYCALGILCVHQSPFLLYLDYWLYSWWQFLSSWSEIFTHVMKKCKRRVYFEIATHTTQKYWEIYQKLKIHFHFNEISMAHPLLFICPPQFWVLHLAKVYTFFLGEIVLNYPCNYVKFPFIPCITGKQMQDRVKIIPSTMVVEVSILFKLSL